MNEKQLKTKCNNCRSRTLSIRVFFNRFSFPPQLSLLSIVSVYQTLLVSPNILSSAADRVPFAPNSRIIVLNRHVFPSFQGAVTVQIGQRRPLLLSRTGNSPAVSTELFFMLSCFSLGLDRML